MICRYLVACLAMHEQHKLSAQGKGILAADESVGTIGKRFDLIQLENSETNRIRYRKMLFSTPDLSEYISGVIVFDETLRSKGEDSEPLVRRLQEQNILVGIKVDKGLTTIPGTEGERSTQGLDGLGDRCAEYYQMGARFAKWRAIYKISATTPSGRAVQENSWALARYGAICQEQGLVPIIEPEVLIDGDHDIEKAAAVTEHALISVYKAMHEQGVLLEGTLLKPNMVSSGSENHSRLTEMDIAAYTIRTLQRTVPVAVPGIVFLSGGQSEEHATLNLNMMNAMPAKKPWRLTFSFGRALQQTCLNVWQGEDKNEAAAQQAFLERCRVNCEAQLGVYQGGSGDTTSLFQANYAY